MSGAVFWGLVVYISVEAHKPVAAAIETESTETAEDAVEETYDKTERPDAYVITDNMFVVAEEDADSALLEDFPLIYQMPELPTGCEITAFTMVLHYYGFDVDKTVMAADYLPKAEYGGDLNNYFIGDPFKTSGYTCGTGAIVTSGNSYLSDEDSSLETKDISGSTPEELYKRVSNGQPITVWVTLYMANRRETEGWYTYDGSYVEWSTNDHGAVLIGYTEDTVTIADPISGIVEYEREQFERVYASRGYHAVVIEDANK